MDNKNLITMANQIGEFFGSMPDHQEALTGIAEHIRRNWAPPMRASILDALDTAEAGEMLPVVRESLNLHRARLTPVAA